MREIVLLQLSQTPIITSHSIQTWFSKSHLLQMQIPTFGLTIRSTLTLPLRVTFSADLSGFLVPNQRAASAAPVIFHR
jgi:hypothetical protein